MFSDGLKGQPEEIEKGGTYMRKRFEGVRERERGTIIREKRIGKWTVGNHEIPAMIAAARRPS